MAKTTGLTLEQAKQRREELKSQGKTLSTSKELGKVEDYIKSLEPQKYGGETVESARRKLSTSTQNIATQEGMSGFGFQPAGTSGFDLMSIYDNAMNSPEITSLTSELDEKKRARDEAISDVNDNPWYSEATRVGKISKIEEKANREINTLTEQLGQKQADAQVRVNIAQQQYKIESDQYQQNLQKLNMLIDSGALLGASPQELSNIAVATGMTTDMVQAIINGMSQTDTDPYVVTSTDDAGNVTVSILDKNTGKVINQNSLGTIGKATKEGTEEVGVGSELYNSAVQAATSDMSSNKGSDGYVSPVVFRTLRAQWVALGLKASDFDSAFRGYINPSHAQDYSVSYNYPSSSATIFSIVND